MHRLYLGAHLQVLDYLRLWGWHMGWVADVQICKGVAAELNRYPNSISVLTNRCQRKTPEKGRKQQTESARVLEGKFGCSGSPSRVSLPFCYLPSMLLGFVFLLPSLLQYFSLIKPFALRARPVMSTKTHLLTLSPLCFEAS